MRKIVFVTVVGSSFYAYYFVGGKMELFNGGLPVEAEDVNGMAVVAKANGFTDIAFCKPIERMKLS